MTRRRCEHEPAVAEAVMGRRWPEAYDQELRDHAASCEACRAVVDVAALLREEYDEARAAISRRDVPLPSAGQIWWRAAVHARADAARAAARPLVWGYGAAAACALGLLAAGIRMAWPSLVPLVDRLGAVDIRLAPAVDMVMAALRARLPIVVTVVACLIAAPIGLYFALRDE